MKVATVVGARPQFIKAAPVSRAIRKHHQEVLIHTGQHYDADMSDVFFEQLAIPAPDHHLGIGSGPHGAMTGRMLAALEETFIGEGPDVVIVFGDTNSTLAAALAAAKMHIPVGHVEAGLRSHDRTMPEEINRVLTDHIATWLWCPTDEAVRQLAAEGITKGVDKIGDVMVDAFNMHAARAPQVSDVVAANGLSEGTFWLATLHRPVNTDDPVALRRILEAFGDSGETILLPLHPRTRAAVDRHGLGTLLEAPNIRPSPPLAYVDLLAALLASRGVLTDSGGVQKEAYLAGRPCITLRTTTEWTETIEDGWNILVGSDAEKIQNAIDSFRPTGARKDHYGDGHAAERIALSIGRGA